MHALCVCVCVCVVTTQHQLLRGPFGGAMSPEGLLQGHSLPSSVSDALEAMVGGPLDDLTVGDLDSAAGLHNEMQADVSPPCCICGVQTEWLLCAI